MSLWEDMQEPCRLYEQRRVSDGEGGFATVWAPGAEFDAAVVRDSATEDRVAEKQGAASSWTVTTKAALEYGDVFKRASDGQAFRVISKAADGKTPSMATFQFNQCTAEAFEVPDGD